MTSLVFTCLLGLATPLAEQQTPPPAVPTTAPQPGQAQPVRVSGDIRIDGQSQQGQRGQAGQGQTATPQGRGGRGAAAPPAAPTPDVVTNVKPSPARYDSASLQYIRIEVTLTDSLLGNAGGKKSMSMIVVDNNGGAIRSQGPDSGIQLNVDAAPHLRPDGRIYLSLTIFYVPDASGSGANRVAGATLNESVSVIVADGKPMVISQSADPRGDRKVTVEVTATVVK